MAQLCDGTTATIASDGRVLGHLPYGDAASGDLVSVPARYAVSACRVRAEMLPDLERLLDAAAADPAAGGRLLALSCQRANATQASVFCKQRQTDSGADRAISAAPPGHSEHATGLAVDFAVRPANGCPDAETCMAATRQYRWLVANAPRYGFEMSFPIGNSQGVKWEPWHWRWVGTNATAPGAARARFLFARARRSFPANPAVDPPSNATSAAPAMRPAVPSNQTDRAPKKP